MTSRAERIEAIAREIHGDLEDDPCCQKARAQATRILAMTDQWTRETDPVFGSVVSLLISRAFDRIETLDPQAQHRFYMVCCVCGGTNEQRTVGVKSTIDLVSHTPKCVFALHLPRLRELANQSVIDAHKGGER